MAPIPNNSANNIKIIDGNTDGIASTITVGSSPRGVAVDEVSNLVYVACNGSQNVYVIDGDTEAILGAISVAEQAEGRSALYSFTMNFTYRRTDN